MRYEVWCQDELCTSAESSSSLSQRVACRLKNEKRKNDYFQNIGQYRVSQVIFDLEHPVFGNVTCDMVRLE